jgi:hypothetical protein
MVQAGSFVEVERCGFPPQTSYRMPIKTGGFKKVGRAIPCAPRRAAECPPCYEYCQESGWFSSFSVLSLKAVFVFVFPAAFPLLNNQSLSLINLLSAHARCGSVPDDVFVS